MANPKRILITGGSGLIGRALVAELATSGYELVVLSRHPERVRGLPRGVRAVGWDAETPAGWGELVDGSLGIVHLAGEGVASGRWTEARKRRIRSSRVESSQAVVAAIEAAEKRPRFLLQASAVGYYGSCGDELITEEHPPGGDFLADVAVEWESVSREVEELGVRRVLLRTGVVLATDGGALPRMVLPFRVGLGGPLGDGRQYVPWIHLADEVAAIRFLLEDGRAFGAYNLTAPHPVRNRELCHALGRVLRRPCLFPAPRPVLRLSMGEMADMILASQRALPRRLEGAGFGFRFPDIDPALEDLLA